MHIITIILFVLIELLITIILIIVRCTIVYDAMIMHIVTQSVRL
jgi:hypothetical protein